MSNGTKAYVINVDGRNYNVSIAPADPNAMPVAAMPVSAPVQNSAPTPIQAAKPAVQSAPVAGTDVTAPTPGLVLKTQVDEGEQVEQDQTILILEAMKMETEIKAPKAGQIVTMHVHAGDTVQTAAALFTIA